MSQLDSNEIIIKAPELSMQEELQHEMMQQAREKIITKKIFEGVQKLLKSSVHEKFYKVTGKGRKEYIQIEWRHFTLQEHDKDKDVITTVNKKKGYTNRGRSYVKDVDVQQRTIHYDYLTVEDLEGRVHRFRLQDMHLDKLPRDRMITLGWLYHCDTKPDNDDVVSAGGVLGQNWEGNLQPTVIITHPKAISSGTANAQWFKAKEFEKFIANSGIGWWHLAWVLPIVSCFILGGKYTEDMGLWLSGVGLFTAFTVMIIRQVQLSKQIKVFANWLADEVGNFTSQSGALIQSITNALK